MHQVKPLLFVYLMIIPSTTAHTSLIKPASREGGQLVFEDSNNTIGCGKSGPGPVTQVQAGQEIDVAYYRNNHIGGFVRWSLAKKGFEAETKQVFDKNTFLYTCRESGADCKPRNGKPYSFWQDAYDGVDVFQILCGEKIKIPEYLEDGEYTLQFTNFGTGHSMQNAGLATPTYRSCADIQVTGNKKQGDKPACPSFVGGDRVTKNEGKSSDECAYFYSNEIPNFVFQEQNPANIPSHYKLGKPAEIEKCQTSHL
jgi:hypothetical protein